MASYAMAHLKLELLLKETGYVPTKEQRLRVYLTNSLEEYHPDTGTLFASWLSHEANESNMIKRDTPVMVVLGNPPYSGISSNMGEWIVNLIEDYKYVDGVHFGERKHWLQDDYVKFIRLGQYLIDKNGEGILAYINNHGFIDNPTFRAMRWHLLKSFDKIYIIDLHGNSKKREVCPDGSKDENVFDITTGVSINLFIKTGKEKKGELAKLYRSDVWGNRDIKYQNLLGSDLSSLFFTELSNLQPFYFFLQKDVGSLEMYNNGFYAAELFGEQSMGVTTARDHFVIDFDKKGLMERVLEFCNESLDDNYIRNKFFGFKSSGKYLAGDTRGWQMSRARKLVAQLNHSENIKSISYRPFDNRFIYFSKTMVDWGREDIMNHLLLNNYALCCVKVGRDNDAYNFLITNSISDKSITSSLDNANVFPLYLYNNLSKAQSTLDHTPKRTPNLKINIVNQIAESLNLKFTPEKESTEGTFAPIDLLDYIYAVLHSPTYREKYKEFLKIDFPRVPYPKDVDTFWQLVKLGGELRQLHLMESPSLNNLITQYPVGGSNLVEKVIYTDGKVYINATQYFANVPQVAWGFYIGGYQPAQKWLKDRKDRTLMFDDILHYQKIVVALAETDRVMGEIDKI